MNKTKSKSALIKINSKNISVLMDTDSGATIIDNETFKKIQKGKANIQLHKTKMKPFPYGTEKPLEILGKFTTVLETINKVAVCDLFIVNKSNSGNILGFSMYTELELIKLNNDSVNKTESEEENKQKTKQPKAEREIPRELECIIDKYKDTFKGTDKLKNYQCYLFVGPTVDPIQQKLRRQPYHLREKIRQKLQELEKENIMESIDTPQPWIRNIVVTPKSNGHIHICLDAREIKL